MKGIIWSPREKTCWEEAQRELEFIKQGYLNKREEIVLERQDYFETSSGDVWKIASAYDSSRGIKCNISYIHRRVSGDIIETIIRPSTLAYPYQAFNYYGAPFYSRYNEEENY